MGWFIDGAEGHEGYVADVLRDGREGSGTTGGGVLMLRPTRADEAAGWVRLTSGGHKEAVVPWSEVMSWRVMCECGWKGSSRPAQEDSDESRYCPQAIEDEFTAEWRVHVQPFAGLREVVRLVEEARDVDRQLDVAAAAARASGATWEAIGKAAGLTKQGAQQRWG